MNGMMSIFDNDTMWWTWIAVGVSAGVGVMLIRRLVSGRDVCLSRTSLTGKTVVVTGASSGIGKATALELAKRGARVVMACRDMFKAKQAVQDIRRQTNCGELIVRKLDLASLQSVRDFAGRFCEEEDFIHVLINNAGVYLRTYTRTEDGLEMQMAVNHFGHFLLVHLLLDKLKASAPSRIVIVSSGLNKHGHIDIDYLYGKRNYKKRPTYADSKLANNLFARELARRTEGTGVSVYCLRPGLVRTDLGRHLPFASFFYYLLWPLIWLFTKSPYEGCQTILYCATAEELQDVSGRFYDKCGEEKWSNASLDDGVATALWNVSEKLTGITAAAQ